MLSDCPHCIKGKTSVVYDGFGKWHVECINCGWYTEIPDNDPRIPQDPQVRKANEIDCTLQSDSVFQGEIPTYIKRMKQQMSHIDDPYYGV